MTTYLPENDGIDHINIYSKGRTEIGRWMSNFAFTPITIPEHGKFFSIEGYWYWLGSGDERLRKLTGFAAKSLGRDLRGRKTLPEDEFRALISAAIRIKAEGNVRLLSELRASTLPLTHYYTFSGIVKDAGFLWIVQLWDDIRCQN